MFYYVKIYMDMSCGEETVCNMIEFTLTLYYECSEQRGYAKRFNLVETRNCGEYMGIYHIRDTIDNVNEWFEQQKSEQYTDENGKFIVNCESINNMTGDSQLLYSYYDYDGRREWVQKSVTYSKWVDEDAHCFTINEFNYIFNY